MSDNIIFNDMDESIGYYKDLYKMFADLIIEAIGKQDLDMAEEQLSYLKEMEAYKDCADILVLSMNNGMGFTCKPYKEWVRDE